MHLKLLLSELGQTKQRISKDKIFVAMLAEFAQSFDSNNVMVFNRPY